MNKTYIAEKTNAPAKIKISEKLGFLVFSGAFNLIHQFKATYYLFFLTEVLKVSMLTAGTILTIGTAWDAINDILVGYWAVNHRFKNGECCRPFLLYYSMPLGIITVLLFVNFFDKYNAKVIWAIGGCILFELFFTLVGIAYNGMGSVVTINNNDRCDIHVFRNVGRCIGTGLGAIACLPLLKLFGGLSDDGNLNPETSSYGLRMVAIFMAIICIIGSIVHYKTTKERVIQIQNKKIKLSPIKITKMLFRSKPWIINTGYIICYFLITLIFTTYTTYYATYILGKTSAATTIQISYLIASIIGSFLVIPIKKRFAGKNTMILGSTVITLGILCFLINPRSLFSICINAISIGLGISITFVVMNTNRNIIVDLIEKKEGYRLDNILPIMDSLAGKVAAAVAIQAITIIFSLLGYNSDLPTQQPYVENMIIMLLGVVLLFISILMGITSCFLNIDT